MRVRVIKAIDKIYEGTILEDAIINNDWDGKRMFIGTMKDIRGKYDVSIPIENGTILSEEREESVESLIDQIKSYQQKITEKYPHTNVLYGAWICPKCGSVYGPMARECYRCNPPLKLEWTCTNTILK